MDDKQSFHFKSVEELKAFLQEQVVNTKQAAEILGCTRQNIKRIVDNGKLVPIKEMEKDRLFLKADVLKRIENKNS
ncbi:helix-turn-helix domain-containing protein [Heyndrickxia oleronia]|uniref:helix-turn-helix domain-containing protein n=1 Tax=Heyndrickxia TaxID=2837504 RepID=UPI00203E09D5|nr:helix-turn-helix domain-containing protein [Heyndrickxia oleronia]MCM3454416.1 helix-turn-helix domain-containing protein [Heyndrickxia oleronia]